VRPPACPALQGLPFGIHVIDTGFHRECFDASYLIVEGRRAAFVDTGTNHGVPRLLAALDEVGLAPGDVEWLIVTHVHLDHAGGAGLLMQSLPNATLVVHAHGARHMINPTQLVESARQVYGDAEMARSYGTIIGIGAERVHTTTDDTTLMLGPRPLRFIDTPGHARHHHCIWDEKSRGFFTGDTFGLSYRELDTDRGAFVLPTSTPVQFEPQALRHSIVRMMSFEPQSMYLTHFGRVGDVPRLATLLLEQLDAMVAIALAATHAPDRHQRLKRDLAALYLRKLREHGCVLAESRIAELLALDVELNAQGIAIWLDRQRRMQGHHA
jgi:glyoxylase-like metal-dependent hydrolase (beta-lactamase superfamily II)